jgi:hemoglobin
MAPLFTEADIHKLVQSFYAKVRKDALLAPIFATKIKADDWERHMGHIADFWSSIFLKTGRFKGNPMGKHARLEGLTPAHFAHWLSLFRQTAAAVLLPAQVEAIHTLAKRIAQSLQMGLAFDFEKSGIDNHPFKEFGIRRPG